MPLRSLALAAALLAGPVQEKKPLPEPTHANVAYGPHERNVLDVWLAKADGPTPLLVHIHGGGWINGDKKSVNAETLKFMLDRGVSVASVNYRYSTIAPLPGPVHDAARAIQFLRSKAAEWKFDKARVAAFGGSAGACSSLWLNYHDDLADPKSADPVARESTRLVAAWGNVGQTSIDPKTIVGWVGDQVMNHAMIHKAVGAKDKEDALARYEEFKDLYKEFSAFTHVDKADPPALLTYGKPTPLPAPNPGAAIHHAAFGEKLKEKADQCGATVVLFVDGSGASKPDPNEFLLKHLKP
jgi:acetyl esterase/lipase